MIPETPTPDCSECLAGSSATAPVRRSFALLCVVLVCGLPVACESTSSGRTALARNGTTNGASSASPAFSGQKAWQHMRAINKLGPRVAGSPGSERSREYMRDFLHRNGIATRELRVLAMLEKGDIVELTHLVAVLPGRSPDVLLLAAHYDTPRDGPERLRRIDQGASGPALLLELARSLSAGPQPPYTLWFTWIDGDAMANGELTSHVGTQSLVDDWSRSGELSQIRAAIFFGDVGDRDLPIVRDIDSPRVYREIFWEVARDMGFQETFPEDSRYGRPQTGRNTFAQSAMLSAIALANASNALRESTQFAPPPAAASAPGSASSSAERSLRRASAGFEAVGRVTLGSLARTASKLRKIDRFVQAPLKAGREAAAEPAAGE